MILIMLTYVRAIIKKHLIKIILRYLEEKNMKSLFLFIICFSFI